jgi:integrase
MATEISNGKQTVKLYHSVNRGKAMYQLAYYLGGRRVQKNFADKGEAKRVARQILGGLRNNAEAVETMATPELESFVAARRVLAPNYALHVAVEEHAQAITKLGKATLREAVEFFLRHHRADMPRLPLSEISEQFANSRERSGLSSQYISHCRHYTRQLAKAFPGHCIADLTAAALDKWMGSLAIGGTTKNDMRRVLGTFGGWAENQGHLLKATNPFLGMIRYREVKATVPIFTPEQMASLLKKADATLRPFLALGAFAGLRTAELQRLDWSEIDLDRGFVTVAASKAKTQRRRLVPILDNLKAWLMPIRQVSGPVCVHVCAQQAAKAKCEAFKWAKNGLRHSFISYRLAVLHDTARVALEAGNSPQVIFGHYRELVTPDAANAWFEIKPI